MIHHVAVQHAASGEIEEGGEGGAPVVSERPCGGVRTGPAGRVAAGTPRLLIAGPTTPGRASPAPILAPVAENRRRDTPPLCDIESAVGGICVWSCARK